ncbi:MAG: HD domain-containing protein [Sedimentisphaerales bacterium]|nr:HD domain-containing protein [Sedimentisphaerales bacterium]
MKNTTETKNRRILVIDDNPSIHEDFRQILSNASNNDLLDRARAAVFGQNIQDLGIIFDVDCAFNGHEGLEKLVEANGHGTPYAVAFVDMRMESGWNGIETIERLWRVQPQLQIVICTAYSDYSWHEIINRLGETEKLLILKKPFDNVEVRQMACSLTEKWEMLNNLDRLVRERTAQIAETRDTAIFVLASLAESRDPETGEHLERIRSYSHIIAEELSKGGPYAEFIDSAFINDLYRSSPLHDIGKIGIPDSILLKPGALTDEEFEIMKHHSVIGAEALGGTIKRATSANFLQMATDVARYHHEKFNGLGYPDGLKGQEIPLAARIVALADVYDALTSSRVYKSAFRPEIAKIMIKEERGRHFDPVIVDAFLARYDDFLKVQGLIEAEKAVASPV